ncbi:hypothetical protein HCB27_16835 [Listeria booriae]|uniref:Uncharacterized protein n=1 Tax=Listeria booriae TaxID=1552123 RepID=A0A7X0Z949_9LIST|nr:hypothetical protein [Listeria booriae]MBC2178176.1 hypothetical protein [Listeria booriae]MBC2178297.1 hypothetical protein [Listeria booriae]
MDTFQQILMWIGLYLLVSYLLIATWILIEEGGLGTALLMTLVGIPLVIYLAVQRVLHNLAIRHIRKYLGICNNRVYEFRCFGVDCQKYSTNSIIASLIVLSTRKLTITEEERAKYVEEVMIEDEDPEYD